jgi:hypothetical protein
LDYLLADSALYTAETLPTLNELCWITRVPESLKEARQTIEEAATERLVPLCQLSQLPFVSEAKLNGLDLLIDALGKIGQGVVAHGTLDTIGVA